MCSTDSLLLTCTANEIIILRVTLPSDGTLGVFNDGTVTGIGTLPAGFSVESSNAIVNPGGLSYNYTLSLSIENASLLNGSMIVCDDNTIHQDMAGCPVVGKFSLPLVGCVKYVHVRIYIHVYCEVHVHVQLQGYTCQRWLFCLCFNVIVCKSLSLCRCHSLTSPTLL